MEEITKKTAPRNNMRLGLKLLIIIGISVLLLIPQFLIMRSSSRTSITTKRGDGKRDK